MPKYTKRQLQAKAWAYAAEWLSVDCNGNDIDENDLTEKQEHQVREYIRTVIVALLEDQRAKWSRP